MKHELYIQRALQLARLGIGSTRPNPSVGAVIVYQDSIIGEGFTSPYGGNHAEVNAIRSVKNQELLAKATIYVTLEPCSHYGNTPPCADLIIEKQIPNIVIGCIDDNTLVAGKGIERLQKAGRNVIVGVLEAECKEHHKRFFTSQNFQRPYVILKWAQTQDGFVAPLTRDLQAPVWISNPYSRQLVHKWRAQEHAILVGTNTVLEDNPSLTVRQWSGLQPTRIVIDRTLRLPTTLNVFDTKVPTIIIFDKNQDTPLNKHASIVYEGVDFSKPLALQICSVLQAYKIQSVIIEGGTKTLQTFIDENLWDEARVFSSNISFGSGIKSPVIKATVKETKNVQEDTITYYYT